MERILSVQQMRQADEYTINNLGFSKNVLTERAGLCIANIINNRFHGGRVLVCIGKGNNGEDGRIVAKALSKVHGFTVTTLNVCNPVFRLFDRKYDIIVDCIFGIGLDREVEGKYREAIEKINDSGAFVISCDIPSGLNADNGKPMGISVKADLTVAIQEFKLGHFLGDGIDYCGETIAKDIGIAIWGDDYYSRLQDFDASKFFVSGSRNVNKGSFGKVLVIGGSKDYIGSPILSYNALTSLKMGNGYSYLAVPECVSPKLGGLNPEIIIKELPDENGKLKFSRKEYESLLKYDSIAFGMGVGVCKEIYSILEFLITNYTGRLLIDADGINTLSEYGVDILLNKKCDVVLTPHLKEFSRLLNTDIDTTSENTIELSKDFANKYGVVLDVKSAVSIITDGKQVIINTTGCQGMAKAGSGDVLSGIICGLLAKKLDVLETTATGAYIFGKVGEFVQNKDCEFTLTASDMVYALPEVIKVFL